MKRFLHALFWAIAGIASFWFGTKISFEAVKESLTPPPPPKGNAEELAPIIDVDGGGFVAQAWRYTADGHSYLVLHGNGYGLAVLHHPDCPCTKPKDQK